MGGNRNVPVHLKQAARTARSKGWVITVTGSGHLRWVSPNGVKVFTSKTPGGNRSHQNTVSKLRKAGLKC